MLRTAKEIGWWGGLLALIVVVGLFANWNENDSPWGRDVQAAKLEHLKKKLCN